MVRIGIVGLGFMGMIHYLAARHATGARVTALCSRDPKKLAGDWRGVRGNFGPAGELKYVGEEWTRGNYPRSFAFDPSGAFLYCCNQRGDNVTVFRVDRKTGGLTFTGHYTPVGNPSCIVFLDLNKQG